ncbi:O-antigen ligase family protein [Gammaproteobacteria bacterium]|nr:O-antigen ligase family protein [Gammaproteobacteria bacterium]
MQTSQVLISAFVLGSLFLLVENREIPYPYWLAGRKPGQGDLAAALTIGTAYKWGIYALMSAFSIALMLSSDKIIVTYSDLLVFSFLAYCVTSTIWSESRWLTAGRVTKFGVVVALAFAVSSVLSFRECVFVVTTTSCLFLVLDTWEQKRSGNVPLSVNDRLFGLSGPSKMATHATFLVFADVFFFCDGGLNVTATLLLAVPPLMIIWLAKTRSVTWPALAGCAIWLFTVSQRPWTSMPVALVFGILVFGIFSLNKRSLAMLKNFLLMGRKDQSISKLSGRTDIWRYALANLGRRAFLGFGFGAFWNDERSAEITSIRNATKPVYTSCSLYIEILMNLGIAGLLLFLLTISNKIAEVLVTVPAESGFVLALLTYVMLHSLFETTFLLPHFRGFVLFLFLFSVQ